MNSNTSATTFVFDVVAVAPAADAEAATTGAPQMQATLAGATGSSAIAAADAIVPAERVDPFDVPPVVDAEDQGGLGSATVTLAGADATDRVVLGEGAGAATVSFIDRPSGAA